MSGEAKPPASAAQQALRMELATQPERIVLCIDVGSEMGCAWDPRKPLDGPDGHSRMKIVKQALCMFVRQKSRMDSMVAGVRHQFAICLIADSPVWHLHFTSEVGSTECATGW